MAALLDLPEAMLQEILRQLGMCDNSVLSIGMKLARARASRRYCRDPDWRLGHHGKSQAPVYFGAKSKTGAAWLKRYSDSIVLWDAAGGARCFPRTSGGGWKLVKIAVLVSHTCSKP